MERRRLQGGREGGESKRGRELKKGKTELEKVYRKGGGARRMTAAVFMYKNVQNNPRTKFL